MNPADCDRISRAIRQLLADRGPTRSTCPSEVARSIAPAAWRDRMQEVRDAAFVLATRGEIEITQGDRRIEDPCAVRGAIRLRLPRR
jgi:hypothetical protein